MFTRTIPATNYSSAHEEVIVWKLVVAAIAACLALIMVYGSWFIVPSGTRAVLTTFSEYSSTYDAGLHFKIPLIQSTHKINVRTQSAEVKNAEGGTHDLQPVHVGLMVRFSIMPDKVKHVFTAYATDGDMDHFVTTATAEAFKSVTAKYSAPNLIIQRSQVSNDVLNALQTKVNQYGLKIENIDMTEFSFGKEYMQAVNAKVREEQNMATQANVLKRIEIEQQQKVVTAKAEAESTQARAAAEAFSITAVATAKAKALEVEGKALRENSNVAELRRIEVDMVRAQRWNGSVPTTMYGSAPIPFVTQK